MTYAKRILSILLVFCVLLNLSTAVFARDSDELPSAETATEETMPEEPAPADEKASSAEALPDEDATLPEKTAPPEEADTEEPTEPEEILPSSEIAEEDAAFASENAEEAPEPTPSEELPAESTEPIPEAENPLEEAPDEASPEKKQVEAVPNDGVEGQKEIVLKTSGYVTGDNVPIYLDFCTLFTLYERDANGFPWMSTQYVTAAEGGSTLVTSGDWIYCIDYGMQATQGLVTSTATDLIKTPLWTNLSISAQRGITHALIYGGKNYGSGDIYAYAATQLIVWEYQLGVRTKPTQSVSYFSATLNGSARLRENYNAILAIMAKHDSPPSFNATSITLKGRGKANGVTLTDTSGQLANDTWRITNNSNGIAVEQNGNNLLVYATDSCPDNANVTITLQRNLKVATGNAICAKSGAQTVIVGVPPDPVSAGINVKLQATGSVKIIKSSDDGNNVGISFIIYDVATQGGTVWKQYTTTNENGYGVITASLAPGRYGVREVQDDQTSRYNPQEDKFVDVVAGQTAEVRFHNTLKAGTAKIIKSSDDGNNVGISFIIYDVATQGGTVWKQYTTTYENGYGVITASLAPGRYGVREVQNDQTSRYYPQEDKFVDVVAGQTAEVRFHNTLRPEGMTGQKTSPTGDVEGYCFKFYSWASGNVWYAKTDAQGNLCVSDSSYSTLGSTTFTDLQDGDYTLLEVLSQKGAGLVFPDAWRVTVMDRNGSVTYDKTYTAADMTQDTNGDCRIQKAPITGLSGGGKLTMTINNAPLTADLEIIKTSPNGKVAGIEFYVTDSTGKEIGRDTTDANGKIVFPALVVGQTYTVTEVVKSGWICENNNQKITIQAGTNTLKFVNKRLDLKLIKKSPDGNTKNITFNVYQGNANYQNGTVWKTVSTGIDGSFTIQGIPAGDYWFREVPMDGYEKQPDQKVTVTTKNTYDNPAIVTFVNVPLSSLKIVKQSPDGKVKDITFNVYQGDANYQNKKIMQTVVSGADGTIQIDKLTAGAYWIEEVVSDDYEEQEPQRVEVTTANTKDNPAIVTFVNVPLSSLKIVKQSPDGKVKDITFNVYQGDTNYQNKKIMQTVVSGADGTIQIDKLTAGVYWIEEIVSDDYEEQEPQRVEVTTANTKDNPAIVTFVNVPLSALKIIKESEDGNVENITFNIYAGEENYQNGTIFQTIVTGKDGSIQIDKLTAGVYWVQEIVPQGYIKQSDKKITLTTANTKDNPAVVKFDNWLQRGTISIEKTNTSGVAIEGATFLLEYSTDGGETWQKIRGATNDDYWVGTCTTLTDEDAGTVTTGSNGWAIFDDLVVYGVMYRVTETIAPPGYQLLADPVFTGEISANDKGIYEIYCNVVNTPKLQMPPTGGDGSIRLIGAVSMLIATSSLLGLALLLRRRESDG